VVDREEYVDDLANISGDVNDEGEEGSQEGFPHQDDDQNADTGVK